MDTITHGALGIAVALLGRSHPLGVVPAALLFAALRAGATRMQFVSQIPIDVISIVQGIVLLLVSADVLVRRLYGIGGRRGAPTTQPTVSQGRPSITLRQRARPRHQSS